MMLTYAVAVIMLLMLSYYTRLRYVMLFYA